MWSESVLMTVVKVSSANDTIESGVLIRKLHPEINVTHAYVREPQAPWYQMQIVDLKARNCRRHSCAGSDI